VTRPIAALLLVVAAFAGALLGAAVAPSRPTAAPRDAGTPPRGRAPEPSAGTAPDPARSTAEWVTVAVSCALVAGLVGLILYLHAAGGSAPAALEARPLAEAARPVDGRFHLPIEVQNRGAAAAEGVRVRVADGSGEDVEIDVDRLAGGATARAVVILSSDPRRAPPRAEVVAFREP
jgi:uncharacterized protein (TIGR02588 family)